MADFDIGGLRSLQATMQGIGKNHVLVDGSGKATASTSGTMGRFFGRLASHFGHGVQENNRRTVEALARQIASAPGVGDEFASLFRNRAATVLATGRPLSGRKVARLLDETVNQAASAYERDTALRRTKAANDVSAFFESDGPGGYGDLVGALENALGVDPGSLGLGASRGEMKEVVLAGIRTNPAGDALSAAREFVRETALERYIDAHLDKLMAAMEENHTLAGMDVDAVAYREKLRRTAYFCGKHDPFQPARFFEGLEVASRAFATELRAAVLADRLTPFLALDASENGLLSTYRRLSTSVVADANIQAKSLLPFQEMIAQAIGKECAGKPVPAGEELRQLRDKQISAFLEGLSAMPGLPEQGYERELVLRTFTEKALPLKPALAGFVVDFSNAVSQGLASGLRLTEQEDLRNVFRSFADASELFHNEALERATALGTELGSEEVTVANELAFALGINRLADSIGMERVVGGIVIHGSPFFDLADALNSEVLAQTGGSTAELAMQSSMRMLNLGLSAFTDGDPGLSSPDISSLSLPYLRTKTGYDRINGPGVESDYGAAGVLSGMGGRIQSAMNRELGASVDAPAPWGSDGDSPSLALCDQFKADFHRSHFMITGKYMRAADYNDPGEHSAFLASFPDRRSAYQISLLIHQGLPGVVFSGLAEAPELIKATLANGEFAINASVRQSYRVEPLPSRGEYRVDFEYDFRSGADPAARQSSPDGQSIPAGYKMHITMDVRTGAAPEISACTSDFLLYGWE